MKALTILQPWASAIALGAKRIETRSHQTSYRGPLAIHAGKGTEHLIWAYEDGGGPKDFLRGLDLWNPAEVKHALPFSAIIAVCELVDCLEIHADKTGAATLWQKDALGLKIGYVGPQELPLGDYTHGRYAWLLADVRALAQPIPCSGKQGLWTPSANVLAQLEAL